MLFARQTFDEIDGGSVAFRGQACSSRAMQSFQNAKAIVKCACKVRRGSAGFTGTDAGRINHEHITSCHCQVVGCGQASDACPDHAYVASLSAEQGSAAGHGRRDPGRIGSAHDRLLDHGVAHSLPNHGRLSACSALFHGPYQFQAASATGEEGGR